jgi:hypothetical protein
MKEFYPKLIYSDEIKINREDEPALLKESLSPPESPEISTFLLFGSSFVLICLIIAKVNGAVTDSNFYGNLKFFVPLVILSYIMYRTQYQDFKHKTHQFNTKLELQKSLRKIFSNEETKKKYFLELRENFIFEKEEPYIQDLHFRGKVGISEKKFKKKLQNIINEQPLSLIKDAKSLTLISDEGLAVNVFSGQILPYQPDILLYSPEIKTYIDIEIDEPYEIESGDPIHYLGNKKDILRDKQLTTKAKWIVFRFSEKQVTMQPYQCIYFILSEINKLCNGNDYENLLIKKSMVTKILHIQNTMIDLDDKLKKDNHWTKDDAIEMAKNNTRQNYLNLPKKTYE